MQKVPESESKADGSSAKKKKSKAEKIAARKIASKLSGLTPTKQLDAILKEKLYYSKWRGLLEQEGIAWDAVLEREKILLKRQAAVKKRADDKKKKLHEDLAKIAKSKPLAGIGVGSSVLRKGGEDVVRLVFDPDLYADQNLPLIGNLKIQAIMSVFPGFNEVSRSADHFALVGSFHAWNNVLKKKESLKEAIDGIKVLDRKYIRQVNRKDAASIAGMTQSAFDNAVQAGEVPVADTITFRKWGRELQAKQFHPADLVKYREEGLASEFAAKREKLKQDHRKEVAEKAAIKAQQTKKRRQKLAEQISVQDALKSKAICIENRDLRSGLYFELFQWAQRASRYAKTKKSYAETAYELKDRALICLFENDALDISFVSSPITMIVEKCDYHSKDWFDVNELRYCPKCLTATSHHYSLYACSLKVSPDTGTLHIPYPVGKASGLPEICELPRADHDRDDCYGRQLDADEVAIFTLKHIKAEIDKLVSICTVNQVEDA